MTAVTGAAARRRAGGPGRLSADEAARLPERLLEAAQAVFLDQGYARATMDAVARAAGTTRKTLYARHADKSALLSAVVERLLDQALAPLRTQLAPATGSPEARALLLQLGRELARLSADSGVAGLNRLILAEATQRPELAALFGTLYARAIAGVRECLDLLVSRGRLQLDEPDRAAAAFIELVASLPRLRALLGNPMSDGELEAGVEHAVDLFLRGCEAAGRGEHSAAVASPAAARQPRSRRRGSPHS
jgi:AcrR family transcriptional regulator